MNPESLPIGPAIRALLLSSVPDSDAARQVLGSLAKSKRDAAVVTTASVEFKSGNRNAIRAHLALEEIGFHSVEFFDFDTAPARDLERFDFVYLSGGNPYYLLKRLRETGGDRIVTHMIGAGRPFAGSSAGALVLGRSIAVVDAFDPDLEPSGLQSRVALGVFPFSVLPHANRWRKSREDYGNLIAAVRAKSDAPLLELDDDIGFFCSDGAIEKILV